MNIEIKMFGGIYEDGEVEATSLEEFDDGLEKSKRERFFIKKKGVPVLVNKRNILSVRKK